MASHAITLADVQERHETLLNHIVLPRFLPQVKSEEFHSEELELLRRMVDNVHSFDDSIPANTMAMLDSMVHIHRNRTENTVSAEINRLEPGRTFAMFIRQQNCTLMIQMQGNANDVIVATFPGKLHPNKIYGNPSDIEFNYPTQAIKLKYSDMMKSTEFANQLCLLYESKPINSQSRDYITKWLMTVLMDEETRTATEQEMPVIRKKIRDEMLGEEKDHFRRSSFYMAVKVILRHSLTHELGHDAAKLLYKIIMLRFLSHQCDFFNKNPCETLNIELVTQTMAKLARRIEKLSAMNADIENGKYKDLKEQAAREASQIIQASRIKVNKQIERIQESDAEISRLSPLTDLDFEADVYQKVPKLRLHMEGRNGIIQIADTPKLKVKAYNRHYMKQSNPANIEVFSQIKSEIEKNLFISDFENWILYDLHIEETRFSANDLRTWCTKYIEYVELFYDGDQHGVSKSVLVGLKMMAVLDKITTTAYPMLLEHHSGINTKVIDHLLLPQAIDMEIAYELEKYFNSRNLNSQDPSLIGESNASSKSFSAKYAAGNKDMQTLFEDIKAMADRKIEEKKQEWLKERERVQDLRTRIWQLSHDYYYDKYHECEKHSGSCTRCSLEDLARNVKISVYERPIPDEYYERNAVVFELRIPLEVACLRDSLQLFVKYCNGQQSESLNIKGNWVDYSQIKQHNRSQSKLVHFGSTRPNVNQLNYHHVDNEFSMFNQANGFNCTFHASSNTMTLSMLDQSIKNRCTLQTQSEYSSLQWTVNSTSHTQNKVLTNQSDCHKNLSLLEFKNFGSLRADGHRLQWRKLYAMIECEALSLENGSVLSLVLQSIWETEVSGNAGGIRESHNEINCLKFAKAFICLLSKFVEKQQNNWAHPIKLLLCTLIAVRVYELNDDEVLADQIIVLLNKIRTVALDWIEKIQQAIKDMQTPDISTENELRTILINVTVAGALTFCVNSNHKNFVNIFMKNDSNGFISPQIWLQFIVTLNSNIILNNCDTNSLPLNLRLLLRLVRNTGIHIESTIRQIIEKDPSDVYKLVKKQWTMSENGRFEKFYFYPNCSQVLIIEVHVKAVKKCVTIDLITGTFLVNNLPICRLPDAITQSKEFKRVFDCFVFEVQPDDDNCYSTVQRYNGKSYEFTHTATSIIIIERDVNCVEIELISPEVFQAEIPELLVENHSHWWNKADNQIELRPRLFSAKNFSAAAGIEYRLDLKTYLLFHLKTRRNMLDVTSSSYLKIVKQLSRLEHKKFIHVLMDKVRVAKVELVRMQLKFKIDCSIHNEQACDLQSNEFNNMRVSSKQKYGTLFGLNHGLLLESNENGDSKPTRLLLMPHGKVKKKIHNSHVSMSVDFDSSLRSPPFHSYQVDEFCRQLKPRSSSFSAWFYLAYLHALTSHGEIEPFIGMSGTEQALHILQSRFVWSSSPYNNEEIQTLKSIAKLSPKRELKQNILKVTWPSYIPSKSAQDTFVFIVSKLISDSQRLSGLHTNSEMEKINNGSELNEREYFRCLHLTPNLRISDEFLPYKKLFTSISIAPEIIFSKNTQKVAISYHKNSYFKPSPMNLKGFVMKNSEKISGPIHTETVPGLLNHDIDMQLDDSWISIYEVIRNQQLNTKEWSLISSLLAHEGNHIGSIAALQIIYMNPLSFKEIDPPTYNNGKYIESFLLHEGTYNAKRVKEIFKNWHSKHYDEDWTEKDCKYYDKVIESNIATLTGHVTSAWPCDSIDLWHYKHYWKDIDIEVVHYEINALLKIWNNNRRLGIFLDKVEEVINALPSPSVNCPNIRTFCYPTEIKWQKYEIDLISKVDQSLEENKSAIVEAQNVWLNENSDSMKTSADWWEEYDQIMNPSKFEHLKNAELFPRTVPNLVLPMLISDETDERQKMIIGALAITVATEQRQERIDSLSRSQQLKPAYDREIENEPHVNWEPREYPEWILFEIEQNLTIRRIQIEVAKRMINPPDIGTKHSTMQLNMGEGKTSVIVPILASVLADGKQACQITVLKSLFATNLKSLRRYLGGLLGRKIYTFPCRRASSVDKHIKTIRSLYEECKTEKGVVLTLPEYRLSFQLKIYETVKNDNAEDTQDFLEAHKWINQNVRNILDESDAILDAKYQLIYTVGKPFPFDGGSNRWIVTQALLNRVPIHMKRLYGELGEDKLEFNIDYVTNRYVYGGPEENDPVVDFRKDVFTPCRIIDQSIHLQLKEALIDDFFGGRMNIDFPEVTAPKELELRNILMSTVIDKTTFESALEGSDALRNIILILSGLLRFEVLRFVLLKRWRVNYGVNDKGHRLIAIPFKAKDVAAEMTEFGHPDITICLTQLSYYYSGLNDDQLRQVFTILPATEDAAATYEKWITSIQAELIDPSIATYSGVNLSDPFQREKILFPLFRFNMNIIDFYLSKVVYPREARSFEKKLICTAWDLCSDHLNHRVTGFSGTNDTKDILPMPIAQNDLEELENTNENVRQMLLQPENQAYENLPSNISAKEILQKLVECDIPILLDSGALMLELNNKQVAEEWLKIAPDTYYDAAVYFDSNDVLQTIDRNYVVAEFDYSVYREKLDRCVVYLDDTHTRGTDLKFPLGSRASVTLSGNITRDKTVQACMRMRQLGKTHSIAFWASFEADIRIRETCELAPYDEITNINVIDFICENSRKFVEDNIVHWARAGHNYTKKLAAHKLHENSNDSIALQGLYDKCVDNEYVTLNEMYGYKEDASLFDISRNRFRTLFNQHNNNEIIRNFIQIVDDGVAGKLTSKAGDVRRFVHCLDEEQEKEQEVEEESQVNVDRPKKLESATPHFDQQLLILISNGKSCQAYNQLKIKKTIIPLGNSLLKTMLFEEYKNAGPNWADHLFVTSDFIRVLPNEKDKCDKYLRPIWWIARINGQHDDDYILLLLSSFECDRLLETFRKSTKSTLYTFRPTLSKLHRDLMNDPDLHVTAIEKTIEISANDSAQIKMYSGSMYFNDDVEENAYCNFLGLIPRPRTSELNKAFINGIINPNGYVPIENRQHSQAIINSIDQCQFRINPVDLTIKLIEAHHLIIRKDSHASSILERGKKLTHNGIFL